MLENREDYVFVTENALKRIAINGAPYPTRSQKLVVIGEDEAYLIEAMRERGYLNLMEPQAYDGVILRITQAVLRATWLYDGILAILKYSQYKFIDGVARTCKWMDTEKVEDYASVMPSGAVVTLNGQNPTSTEPQGVAAAIADAQDEIDDLNDQLSEDLQSRFNLLSDDLNALYDLRDSLVEQAEETRDSAVADAESSLQSDLAQMKTEHEAAVEAITKEYQEAMDDPDADHEEARKKYEKDLLDENNGYEIDVSARKDKARIEKADAESECRRTTWDAECDLYDTAKEKYRTYAADVKELQDTCHDDIIGVESQRNQTIASLEQGAVYFGYLMLDTGAGHAPRPAGDGVDYSDALAEMADTRKEMEIDALCLGKYLRKTPLLPTKPQDAKVSQDFVAHAPSSDATMRAYADLERMRCLTMTPPFVYRNAYYITDTIGSIPHYDEKSTASGGNVEFYYKSESRDGSVVLNYSDTSFSVFFGRRLEVEKDWVEAIYATLRIYRNEYASSNDVPYITNRTLGFMRVKLDYEGIQCESDLADIDRVRDELAETLAHYAEIRDAAHKTALDAYYLAIDRAQKAYDDAIDAAETARTNSFDAAHRTYMASMEAAEKTFNTKVVEIEENDELDDEEKEREIEDARSRYNSAWSAASDAEETARQSARQAYSDAEHAAVQARTDAEAAALQARNEAYRVANQAYDDATDGLAEDAQEEIDEIKQRPSQRRQAATDDYDDAVAAAVAQRDSAVGAASTTFTNALYSLTVDGDPILPDHSEDSPVPYLRYTSSFPYRTLTTEAYNKASEGERDAFYAAFNSANSAYRSAQSAYNSAVNTASYNYWYAKSQIEDIREDARCRWTFTPGAIDSDGLSLPSGDNASHIVSLSMAGIEHFDIVYKPKSLTGADFSDYYAELDGEAATGPTAP